MSKKRGKKRRAGDRKPATSIEPVAKSAPSPQHEPDSGSREPAHRPSGQSDQTLTPIEPLQSAAPQKEREKEEETDLKRSSRVDEPVVWVKAVGYLSASALALAKNDGASPKTPATAKEQKERARKERAEAPAAGKLPLEVENFLAEIELVKHNGEYHRLEIIAASFLLTRKTGHSSGASNLDPLQQLSGDQPVAFERFGGTKQIQGPISSERENTGSTDAPDPACIALTRTPEVRGKSRQSADITQSPDNLYERWSLALVQESSQSSILPADAGLVDSPALSSKPLSEPLSPQSSKFIEELKDSISHTGKRPKSLIRAERAQVTDKGEDAQLSGEWRSVQGQEDAPRPVMPPAALRKKKKPTAEQPKISIEDRLAGENIVARKIEEEEKIRLQRLKDKTTGGQYHIFLIIYAVCIVLAFLTQHVAGEDLRNATSTAGKSVTNAVDRMMLPKTFSNFAVALRYYEDEATKDTNKRGAPTFISSIAAGWEAAVKVATSDAPANASKTRRNWYQLPTGFFFGWPAAALYAVRQVYIAAIVNKSGLELLLNLLMYLSLIAISTMVYLRAQRKWPVLPVSCAPIVILVFLSLTSTIVSAVMTFSNAICKVPMPDTIELFTALAIIAISCTTARFAFLAPKAKAAEGH